jgi:hypothetical protein
MLAAGVMLAAGILALHRPGGMGAKFIVLGGLGGALGGIAGTGQVILNDLGAGLLSKLDLGTTIMVMRAIPMVKVSSWMIIAVGLLLMVSRTRAVSQ